MANYITHHCSEDIDFYLHSKENYEGGHLSMNLPTSDKDPDILQTPRAYQMLNLSQ